MGCEQYSESIVLYIIYFQTINGRIECRQWCSQNRCLANFSLMLGQCGYVAQVLFGLYRATKFVPVLGKLLRGTGW